MNCMCILHVLIYSRDMFGRSILKTRTCLRNEYKCINVLTLCMYLCNLKKIVYLVKSFYLKEQSLRSNEIFQRTIQDL